MFWRKKYLTSQALVRLFLEVTDPLISHLHFLLSAVLKPFLAVFNVFPRCTLRTRYSTTLSSSISEVKFAILTGGAQWLEKYQKSLIFYEELRFMKLALLVKSCKMILFERFFKHCVSSGIYEEKSSRFPIMINERCGKNACCKCHYDSSHTFNGKRGYFFPLGIKISSEFQNCYAFKSPMMN